ncbi:MAG: DUF4062 domain-containing protein [Aliishimia sp.]
MAKIYISSTFADLEDFRARIYAQLRRSRHDVISMEDYNPGTRQPLTKCLDDVRDADIYVGLFAWRYGYIPDTGNPDQKSITELEYREAVAANKEIIVFLLDDAAPWPPSRMDSQTGEGDAGARIKTLRNDLAKAHGRGTFTTPDDLAAHLSPAVQEACDRLWPVSPDQLDELDTLSLQDLQNLAARFEIENPFDQSPTALRDILTKKADEYRGLKSDVDNIEDGLKRLSNLKAAAQDAIARIDLEEVEEILARVQEVEKEEAAKTAELRAENALLRGRVEQAAALYADAADSFRIFDPVEPARRRLQYEDQLYQHGLRYGGPGMALSEQMIRDALATLDKDPNDQLWAHGQNNLGNALQNQGTRTQGEAGTDQLAQAVTAYRAALQVPTRADHPVQWAVTQNNLGGALRNQGTRTQGAAGADLLAQAVTAYRAALQVRTRADYPVQWAMTQNNIGNALGDQGIRTQGAAGADQLAQAVTAYRAALEVYTRADHPVDWAGTQENIAYTLKDRAAHDSTQDQRPDLEAALEAVTGALDIYDPVHMSYDYGTAIKLRDHIQAKLDALPY